MRRARGARVLLACSVVAASLPPYAVFWTWWQAAGPGSALGDWCAAHGQVALLRAALLAAGMVSWAWPFAAWAVLARDASDEDQARELGALDGEGVATRLARAFRADRAALALGGAVTFVAVAGSTVAFDLAQVHTYGFELRALDVQGIAAGTVLRAGLPAVGLAFMGALLLASWPVRPREESLAPARAGRVRVAWAVVLLSLLLPLAVLLRALFGADALRGFGTIALRGALGTFGAAAGAGALAALVACGHLALAARGAAPGRGAGAARTAERAMLAGWVLMASVPATVAALALGGAYNGELLGPAVYDTPAIMVLAHLARFGVVAAWIGRLVALREPRDRREARLLDAGPWRGLFGAFGPEAGAAALASALAVTTLGAGEVIVSARLEPPGWSWASATLLNAIHYQQPATVLGALVALLAIAVVAGGGVARLLLRPAVRAVLLVFSLALLPVAVGGCRDASAPDTAPAIQATRWFGGPGRGKVQFEYPRVLEIDPRDGAVYVIDRQARVQRFDADGRWQREWRMPEKEMGKPTGMGIAPDGTVWVADTHYHRVIGYTPEGTEVRRFGSYGTEPGQFIFPCDVEFGPDGNLWVCEFGGNDRIQVFRTDGTFVRQIGAQGRGPGQFDRPQSIAFAPLGDELFVTDACNHRIQVLRPDGAVVRILGGVGEAPGQFVYPYGLERLPDGTLLVAEFGNNRVQRIDPRDGRCLGIGSAVRGAPTPVTLQLVDGDRMRSVPSGANMLRFPWAAGVREGRAYVLDSGHSRVLVFPVESLPVPPGPDAAAVR
jgi:DNA-binding beta-propeller fold protein YncE